MTKQSTTLVVPPVVTRGWLAEHPKCIFIFGDNQIRKGKKGGAALRGMPNAWGFITKRYPDYKASSYYKPTDYRGLFEVQLYHLEGMIQSHPNHTFLISKLGAGLANKYNIWEEVIKPGLEILAEYDNVIFLYRRD
jgi:hypothetical protein